jgi:hypothetical protein
MTLLNLGGRLAATMTQVNPRWTVPHPRGNTDQFAAAPRRAEFASRHGGRGGAA